MPSTNTLSFSGGMMLTLTVALTGCGKLEQSEPQEPAQARAAANRQKAACGSSAAYDRLKALVFDQAVERRSGDRANLDALADYSTVRMEDPIVNGRDPSLDLTRCEGRMIVEVPPGAERGFDGDRRLEADVRYTAQAAADGNGLVYRLNGAEPIVARLAAFNLTVAGFRPPPAIDESQGSPESTRAAPDGSDWPDEQLPEAFDDKAPHRQSYPAPRADEIAPMDEPPRKPAGRPVSLPSRSRDDNGEATVRDFYAALRNGDGQAASARIVPEKQSSHAFSPGAMSRFYGTLREPIRLTGVTPIGNGAYRVRYVYSAGRSRCDGSAIVRLTTRGERSYIQSIQALSGC